MEFKNREGYLLLTIDKIKVGLFLNGGVSKKLQEELDIGINTKDAAEFNIFNTGEYETKGVYCICHEEDGKRFLMVEAGGVSILLLPIGLKLSNQGMGRMGDIDILVLIGDDAEISSEVVKTVSKIDPKVLLLSQNISTPQDQLEKAFNLRVSIEEKKYKFTVEDFDNEDFKLQLIHINGDS